jgi:hypothetical protein
VKTDKRRPTFLWRIVALVLAALSLGGATGCGGFFYALESGAATSKLEQAHTLQAEKHAPYEYFYAQEHLQKAAEEAAHAEYGHAIHFAETANTFAQKAITLSQDAHEGAGR